MTRYERTDDDVVVIVGSGAGGGTLAYELCRRGIPVVLLESGKHWTPEDFVHDEWASFGQLAWQDTRTTSGSWRLGTDFPSSPTWTCKAVGGTTTVWGGCCPRLSEHEMKARSVYGPVDGANLLDWPISRAELDPYYDQAEKKLGVTGTNRIPPLPPNENFKVLAEGARRLGYRRVDTGLMAINSLARDGRPASSQDGFTFQGDKSSAKWSTLAVEIPRAQATGRLDLRCQSHVTHINHDRAGRITSVSYVDADGGDHEQRARAVCVAANSVETPRLLLNSVSDLFPHGLANSSGQVGRNYMRHTTGSVFAIFDQQVHMYKGETMAGAISDEARHDATRGFAGGYYLELIALGLPFTAMFIEPGGWGPAFTERLDAYPRMAGVWICGEDMPRETNRVTLNPAVSDQYGQPAPDVHFDDHPNDLALLGHARRQAARIYEAVGALETIDVPAFPSGHNLGTTRMSNCSADGVVDEHGRCHDVANLFISDGSQFTTGGAANPTLTIVALAIRQAEHVAAQISGGQLITRPRSAESSRTASRS